MNTHRKLKPFTGDLRQTILDACAEVGGGTVEGYLDKVFRERPKTALAKQAQSRGARTMPRRKDEWMTSREAISVEIGGVAHHGYYQTERRMVRVSYRGSAKVTQLGGMAGVPETLARVLLAELVREAAHE
jgi:hypothetical protein